MDPHVLLLHVLCDLCEHRRRWLLCLDEQEQRPQMRHLKLRQIGFRDPVIHGVKINVVDLRGSFLQVRRINEKG